MKNTIKDILEDVLILVLKFILTPVARTLEFFEKREGRIERNKEP
jgi:hypothetical protein